MKSLGPILVVGLLIGFGLILVASQPERKVAERKKVYIEKMAILRGFKDATLMRMERSDGSRLSIHVDTVGLVYYTPYDDSLTIMGGGWKWRLDFADRDETERFWRAADKAIGVDNVELVYERDKENE